MKARPRASLFVHSRGNMFVDEVTIDVQAGNGGSGSVAFRREKFVPRGGPAGGEGGRGGDVVLIADERMTTLLDYHYQRHYRAEAGGDGGPNLRHGKHGEHCELRVPLGTVVHDEETGEWLADLIQPGQKVVVARGGRGGHGNAHFANPSRQTPRFAEKGEPGERRRLRLELKLLADVGLVGYPNVGKSTLISRISAAKPKISDYPFTTLVPNLGVVAVEAGRSFVVADLPGLIEGAHAGEGLGHQFLRHVERCRVLVHLVDISNMTGRDPLQDFEVIQRELNLYNPSLLQRPMIVALNKVDVAPPEIRDHVRESLEEKGYPVHVISAATGEGVQRLVYHLAELLDSIPLPLTPVEEMVVIRAPRQDERAWQVMQVKEHEFVVQGKGIERMVKMTDLENEEAVRLLHRKLERIGVLRRLRDAGIQHGDTVRIGDEEFDFVDEERGDAE